MNSKMQFIMQIRDDVTNPAAGLSGYEPTTGYWPEVIKVVNTLLFESAVWRATATTLQADANELLVEEVFSDKVHTAVEWAELVMAINHILWFLHGIYEGQGSKDKSVQTVLEALTELYYEWHKKALDTLEGDDLNKYLHITD